MRAHENNLQDLTVSGTPSHVTLRPGFVLSAGWRSGSTLLQRLLCSSQEVLLGGSPMPVAEWSSTLRPPAKFCGPLTPTKIISLDARSTDLQTQWIANFFPPPSQLKDTYRSPDASAMHPRLSSLCLKEVRLMRTMGDFFSGSTPTLASSASFAILDAWQSAKGL